MSELIKAQTSVPGSPGMQTGAVPAHGPASQAVDIPWLWRVLLKRRLLILLSAACAVVPTAIFVAIAEPLYRSTVTIQFDPESAKVLPYKDVSDTLANPLPHFELYMKTQQELLKSATLHTAAAERARRELERFGAGALDAALQKGPQIDRLEGSQVLRLSHTAPNPELAAAVANLWADEFIRLHGERRSQTGDKASEFLRHQLAKLKQNVEKAEADLIDYARRHEILSIDSRQENVIRQRFGYLSTELSRAEKELIGKKAEFEALTAVSLDEFPDMLKSPVIVSLETRVFQAEQDLSRLLAQFDEKWPAVVQKKQELALARGQLRDARQTALTRARKQAEMSYNAARSECEMLGNSLRSQAGLVNRLNQASVEYNTLKRDFEANEQLYQGLLQRLKETGVSAGLELGNIHIVDRARPENEPFRPRKGLNLAMALILGLSLGIGASVLLESVSRTLSDPWEVEAYGVPLLGWIPKLLDGAARQPGKEVAIGFSLAPMTLSEAAGKQADGLSKSEYRARESYRALCASLLLSQPDSPPRTILVTSAAPKEGKTTATASLGLTLAEMGFPTLLIDADFRNPSLARRFGLNGPVGLSTFLAGGAPVVHETSVANLHVLPAGPLPPNPVALFNSTRMSDALVEMKKRFHFVLVDGPPVLSLADASVLASKVNGVILIVQAGRTPQEVVSKAITQLSRSGACILGAAVNQVDLRRPEYSAYQSYYYHERTGTNA